MPKIDIEKWIRNISILAVFLFPLLYIKGFFFEYVAPHAFFIYFISELLLLLYLFYALKQGKIAFNKSYVTVALFLYIAVLFVTAITGVDFGKSFWSSYSRMTGLLMWLHYAALFFVVSSVLKPHDWRYMFRAVALSGGVLAIVSYLGVDGLNISALSFMKDGGSFLGNNSYSGVYFLLVFFLSFIGLGIEKSKIWKKAYVFLALLILFTPEFFNFRNPASLLGVARASTLVLWFGMLVFIVLFAINKLKNKKLVVGLSLSLMALIFGIYAYGFASILSQKGPIYERYVAESGEARPILLNIALKAIKERPILGYGIENFNYVYERNLDPRILSLERTLWFDHAHNYTLDETVNSGVLGAVALIILFGLITYESLRFYLKEKKLYLILIPFILVFHFLQLQTFFQTDSAALLVIILIAFLASHRESVELKIPAGAVSRSLLSAGAFIAFVVAFYSFVYVPVKQNLLVSKFTTASTALREQLAPQLKKLKVDPPETLNTLSEKFLGAVSVIMKKVDELGIRDKIAAEFNLYLDIYGSYAPRYENNYRFLLQYAKVINAAYFFGINELETGEMILHKVISISAGYPRPYTLLALNLYYQGRYEEALPYAKKALDITPSSEQAKGLYDLILSKKP